MAQAVEQSYKQCKTQLGWAAAMVRADVTLRRHWLLIFCVFTYCWLHWLQDAQRKGEKRGPQAAPAYEEKKDTASVGHLARSFTPGAELAQAVGEPSAVVARLEPGPAPSRTTAVVMLGYGREGPSSVLRPKLTNYR